MSGLLPRLMLLLLALTMAGAAHSATIPQETIQLAAGSDGTTINGTLEGDDIIDYVLAVRAGGTLVVSMTSDNSENYFNILAPGQDDVAFFTGAFDGNSYVGQVTESGNYKIRVYLTSDAVRAGKSATYSLTVQVTPEGHADSPQGGPDFWQVSGGPTELYRDPSSASDVLQRVAAGTVLRNLGCTPEGGTSWCRVKPVDDSTPGGWVRRRALVQSSHAQTGSGESQPATRTQRVRFLGGSSGTVLKASLDGGQSITYLVDVSNGAYLSVTLDAKDPSTGFQHFHTERRPALQIGRRRHRRPLPGTGLFRRRLQDHRLFDRVARLEIGFRTGHRPRLIVEATAGLFFQLVDARPGGWRAVPSACRGSAPALSPARGWPCRSRRSGSSTA